LACLKGANYKKKRPLAGPFQCCVCLAATTCPCRPCRPCRACRRASDRCRPSCPPPAPRPSRRW